MKSVVLSLMLVCASSSFGALPEDGPYRPKLPSDFLRATGEYYPATLAIRTWKPALATEYAGHFVNLADSGETIDLRVAHRKSMHETEWQTDGEWKPAPGSKHPRVIEWKRSPMELSSKHTYSYSAGGLFIFFVQYRDPDQPNTITPAVLIGDHLFVKK